MDSSVTTPKPQGNFKQFQDNFQRFFWWATPIGVLADLIAIWSLFDFQQKVIDGSVSSTAEPRVLGFISISDAIVLTGFVTAFLIVSTIYLSITKSTKENLWPKIFGSFLSLLITWSYFRLWLGEHRWLWILLAFDVISIIVTIVVFIKEDFTPNNRLLCASVSTVSTIITVFLFVTTGAIVHPPPTEESSTTSPIPVDQLTLTNLVYDQSTSLETISIGTEQVPVNVIFPTRQQVVVFEKNTTSHVLVGSLTPAAPIGYKLFILDGQQLRVSVKSGDVAVAVWDLDSGKMEPSMEDNGYLEVAIPRKEYYIVGVYGSGEFAIEVEIPPLD
jgi:hypothetical protein